MAKRYYWLKLKEDFFDDDTMQYIEEQENGIHYSNFYMKLCLKSLKSEGKLIRLIGDTLIPYDVKSLSKLTGVDIDTVRVAMALFERIGLVKILDTGELYLTQMQEMIGSETDKAQIMRRKRAEEKSISNNVTHMLPECYTEKEKEREKDIEIDKRERINYQEIVDLYNNTCVSFPRVVSISENRKKAIRARLKTYCVEDLKKLFEIAEKSDFLKGKNDRNWTATFDWMLKDSNLAKILEGNYNNRTEKQQQKPNKNKFHNFEQRTYDYGALEQACFNKVNGIPTDAGIGGVR